MRRRPLSSAGGVTESIVKRVRIAITTTAAGDSQKPIDMTVELIQAELAIADAYERATRWRHDKTWQ